MICSPYLPPVRMLLLIAGISLMVQACAQFPQIEAFPEDGSDQTPGLLPIDQLVTQAQSPQVAAGAGESLTARAARLKARAALMRGPILDPATRARLTAAIQAGRA